MNLAALNQLELDVCTAVMTSRVLRPLHPQKADDHLRRATHEAYLLGLNTPRGTVMQYLLDELDVRAAFERGQRDRWDIQAKYGLLYVADVVIRGTVRCDMYDHAPGFAYYSSAASWSLDELASMSRKVLSRIVHLEALLLQGCGLGQAQEAAEELLEQLQRTAGADPRNYAGQKTPEELCLLDQFGGLVQRLDARGWVEPVPRQSWRELEARADELGSQASFERSWDNFATADGLDAKARDLRERVEVSQRLPRVVRRELAHWRP